MDQYVEDKNFDSNLRLGDLISGFSYILPTFDDFINNGNEFNLDIKVQEFFAVLTPCCSIEEKLISLAPLKKINYKYFENPYYKEDMTRINRPMSPENAYPIETWKNFSDEVKNQKINSGGGYTLFEKFIYGSHDKLPFNDLVYKSNPVIKSNILMIDFKDIFTISSKKIQRGNSYPKIAQLTIKSRGELRDKISYFYNRVPEEDKIID